MNLETDLETFTINYLERTVSETELSILLEPQNLEEMETVFKTFVEIINSKGPSGSQQDTETIITNCTTAPTPRVPVDVQ